jgi:hypothetical protein
MSDTAKINIGIDAKALENLIKSLDGVANKLNDTFSKGAETLKKGQEEREKEEEKILDIDMHKQRELLAEKRKQEVETGRMYAGLFDKIDKQKKRTAKEVADLEKRTANEIAAQKAKHLSQQQALLRSAGFGFQAMGFEKTGYLLRGMAQVENLTGALGAMAIPIALAGAGLYGLVEVVKNVAGAFTGAITELGKAKSLQQMIVSAGHGEYSAAQIAGRTGETTSNVLSAFRDLSKNTPHSINDIAEWTNSYLQRAGGKASDFTGLGKLATNLNDLGVANPGEFLGMLREEHPDLSAKQLSQVSASLYNLSTEGGFDINSEQGLRDTIAMAKSARADVGSGIVIQSGLTQALSSVGDKAQGVKLAKLEEKLLQHPDKFASLGDYLQKNADGTTSFKDIEKTFADLAVQASTGKLAKGELSDREAVALKELGERYHNNSEEIQKHIEALENGTEVINKFNGAIEKVHDTAEYRLGEVFNQLNLALGPGLLDTVKNLIPILQNWEKYLGTEEGKKDIENFISAIKNSILAVNAFAETLKNLIPSSNPGRDQFSPEQKEKIEQKNQEIGNTVHSAIDAIKNWVFGGAHVNVDNHPAQPLSTTHSPSAPTASSTGQ